MLCFSRKCAGPVPGGKGVAKFENQRVIECPDCNSALYQTFGSGRRKIRESQEVNRPDANHGLRSKNKYDSGLGV